MELNRDLREFIECFTAHDVRFLVVGGYALAAHGHPRYTKDLDVWVLLDVSNADRVLVQIDGIEVPVIGRAALRRNKLASGRLQDLADVERLGPDDES